jgi:Ni,Fe-hydrogenase maturation factor
VVVIACEPADAEDAGWGLSDHVGEAVERAVGLVFETIDSLRAHAVRESAE